MSANKSMGTILAEAMKAERRKLHNETAKQTEKWFQERLVEDARKHALKPVPQIVEEPQLPIVIPEILPVSGVVPPKSDRHSNQTTLVLCGKTDDGHFVFLSKGRQDKNLSHLYVQSALFPIGSKVELTSGDFPIIGFNYSMKSYVMGGKNVKIVSAMRCEKESLNCKLEVKDAAERGGRRRGTKRRGTKHRRTKRSTRRR
jgi:hypothetical protein